MIVEVKMYACKCDNCGKQWEDDHYGWTAMTDEFSIKQMIAEEDGWHEEDGKHYCNDCFQGYDDNDEVMLRELANES